MKRWLVIILLILSTACAPEYSGKTPPPIVDGTIDLSGWDFEKDGPVELKGEWLSRGYLCGRIPWEKLEERWCQRLPEAATNQVKLLETVPANNYRIRGISQRQIALKLEGSWLNQLVFISS